MNETTNTTATTKLTYQEWKKQRQEEFNALPIFFAFSDKQLAEALAERNVTVNDIYSMGAGGFYLKYDAQIIRDYYNRPDSLLELMKDPDFAESAFYYEMSNHEYHINWQGDWDVCNCFSRTELEYHDSYSWKDYLKAMNHEDWIEPFAKAKRRFYKDCEENDWF